MRKMKLKLLVVCIVAGCLVAAGPALGNKEILLDTETDWLDGLGGGNLEGMTPSEWGDYVTQWNSFVEGGNDLYPADTFVPPTLYVYDGSGGGELEPNDAGLVMYWDTNSLPDGNYCSAFVYDFLEDPDLRNCTITVTVTAPQFSLNPPHSQINQVSLGLQNLPAGTGPIRAWYWNCGVGQPIPWNTPTTITIDLSKIGVTAATPTASSYVSNPAFNLATVQFIIVDEGGVWVGGPQNAPPPGGAIPGMWNYWHNLVVSANPPPASVPGKWYVKWSQPPDPNDPNGDPPVFNGWDELSDYINPPIVADDWRCTDDRPVTDIHWWGSFIGWNLPLPPKIMPKAFHIGIWNDIPDPNPGDPTVFSHPNEMVWENYCDNWVWNFAGYDEDPRAIQDDTCFQFTQLLSQDEWFWQDPCDPCEPAGRVYWLSIAAIYDPCDYTDPEFYPWGWKTRPHFFNDDAVRITNTTNPVDGNSWPGSPLTVGHQWVTGGPIFWPDPNFSWDVAFELTTNKPAYHDDPIPGDLDLNKVVNLFDLDIFARNWLNSVP
ncbi:MAG: DUF7901 domain-containing protein [Planctomycetota bacterium]|jgi:hypothetical protein